MSVEVTLSPAAKAEAQRILDGVARRIRDDALKATAMGDSEASRWFICQVFETVAAYLEREAKELGVKP